MMDPRSSRSNRRPWHRKVEAGVGMAFAMGILTLLALGDRVRHGFEIASATTLPHAEGPGLGILAAIVGLILLNGLLIAAETAIEHLRPTHLRIAKERNGKRYDRLNEMLEQRPNMVAACALASRIGRFGVYVLTFLLSPTMLELMRDRFGWANNHANLFLSLVILLVPVGLIHFLVAELLPKSYAAVNPMSVAVRLYGLIKFLSFLLRMPASLVTSVRTALTTRFGSRAEEGASLAEEEIKTLAESGEESGEIEVGERQLLHSVFEFTDTVAREVMTPRVDVDAVSVRSDPTEVARLIQETGHSRIPLYEETDDQIVGIIHAKDLFAAMLNGSAKSNGEPAPARSKKGHEPPNLRALMRPALFVPENKGLYELLTEMRLSKSQMAIVQDEFGGTAGIVTIEDIVEELVGEIVDEYDVEEPEIIEAAGGWLVDGKTHLDDVNEVAGSNLDSEEFDTIGGYVFGLFGRQPKLGEQFVSEGLRFIVAETDGRRIMRLKVELAPETADVPGAPAAEH
jgi:putative hemolysin